MWESWITDGKTIALDGVIPPPGIESGFAVGQCRVREAQAALDARNARYKTAARSAQRKAEAAEADPRELSERLGAAEKAVEKFVAKRIQPAVQKVSRRTLLMRTIPALLRKLCVACLVREAVRGFRCACLTFPVTQMWHGEGRLHEHSCQTQHACIF